MQVFGVPFKKFPIKLPCIMSYLKITSLSTAKRVESANDMRFFIVAFERTAKIPRVAIVLRSLVPQQKIVKKAVKTNQNQ